MSLTLDQLHEFAAGLAAAPERWRHYVRHDSGARVYQEIWNDGEVNAWVICWSEDQDTGFHDHDESGAVIAVVSENCDAVRVLLPRKSMCSCA